MKLASLYSGGKDSAFSLYLAEQTGYEVPYLISIRPSADESWIFHTPNQDAVPEMAAAMGKKLITAVTPGSEEGDMEALRAALSGLDIDGVVTGAIWSDYQWDRINAVCGDLGLFVFAPLWRKDQDLIMDEIINSGIKAVIVGCYAEGLDGSWLGRPINAETVEELKKIREKTGISIAGEGGEYESMVLFSPLFSHPLEIESCTREITRHGGTLRIVSFRKTPPA
ncbi:MAG: diphthine--ammonia ligase [Candidatus Methanomethylophilaceae archaeon]|nr:diphthine--ammonia ligase [Candidatus Methanomethylophilaceae archaeon]